MIYVETVQKPGQRNVYKWSVYIEDETDATLLDTGDSYYKWNSKRAARRAAKRYSTGVSQETTEIYSERFEENAS